MMRDESGFVIQKDEGELIVVEICVGRFNDLIWMGRCPSFFERGDVRIHIHGVHLGA